MEVQIVSVQEHCEAFDTANTCVWVNNSTFGHAAGVYTSLSAEGGVYTLTSETERRGETWRPVRQPFGECRLLDHGADQAVLGTCHFRSEESAPRFSTGPDQQREPIPHPLRYVSGFG